MTSQRSGVRDRAHLSRLKLIGAVVGRLTVGAAAAVALACHRREHAVAPLSAEVRHPQSNDTSVEGAPQQRERKVRRGLLNNKEGARNGLSPCYLQFETIRMHFLIKKLNNIPLSNVLASIFN